MERGNTCASAIAISQFLVDFPHKQIGDHAIAHVALDRLSNDAHPVNTKLGGEPDKGKSGYLI
jgi:hypothetical protein